MTTPQKATWNPAQYGKFKALRSKPFFDLMGLVRTGGIETALDLGCGTGELTRKLFDHVQPRSLIGVDSSQEMLDKSGPWLKPGLTFELADIADYQPRGDVDLLFSNAAIHWVPDHETALPRLLSWVKPAGQVAIQMPCNFDHPAHELARSTALRLFPQVFSASESVSSTLTVERYAEIFFHNGFEDQICRVEVYPQPMPSGDEVVEWTRGSLLTAYESRLSPDDFAKYLAVYREAFLAVSGAGPYFYTFKRLLLWGRKHA